MAGFELSAHNAPGYFGATLLTAGNAVDEGFLRAKIKTARSHTKLLMTPSARSSIGAG
ncbi:hypothetical protein ACVBEJ_13850 [Porticoccus sp. GXU_MW_L64]